MNCTRLLDELKGSGEEFSKPLMEHLRDCTECRGLAARHQRAKALLKELAQEPDVAWPGLASLRTRARSRIRRRRQARAAWALPVAAAIAVALGLAWPPMAPTGPGSGPAAVDEVRPGAAGIGADIEEPVVDLRTGQEVATGDAGATMARTGTGVVRLAARSRLRVEEATADATFIRLEDGLLEARVEHRAPGQSFEVRTEYATVRVVGTRFTVVHHPGADTEVRVEEGEVLVEAPGGRRLARIPAGGAARFEPSGATDPSPLPNPVPDPPSATCPNAIDERKASRSSAPMPPGTPSAPRVPLPGPVGDVLARAQELLSAGKGRQAIELLASATDLPPGQEGRALALSGDAHRASGSPEAALRAYERAVSSWSGPPPETLLVDLSLVLDELGRPSEVATVWQRYLETWPNGRFVGRALDTLARDDEAAGRFDEALARVRRLLDQAPACPEAMPAFVRIGRALVDRGDLEVASGWFEARLDSPGTALAEAALVGLMRVRIQQGRADEVRALGAEHARRFPDALRRLEVLRLLQALVLPAPGGM